MNIFELIEVFNAVVTTRYNHNYIDEDSNTIYQICTPFMLMFGCYIFLDRRTGSYIVVTYGRFEEEIDIREILIGIREFKKMSIVYDN